MTIHIVRVTRTYTEEITDYVDIEVIDDAAASNFGLEQKAKALVKAKMLCGHDIDWTEEKSATIRNAFIRIGDDLEAQLQKSEGPQGFVEQVPLAPPRPRSEPLPLEEAHAGEIDELLTDD